MLQESLERHDLAMRGSNEALWDWDAASDVIYISPRFNEFLGLPPERSGFSPAEWAELVHPDDLVNKIEREFFEIYRLYRKLPPEMRKRVKALLAGMDGGNL